MSEPVKEENQIYQQIRRQQHLINIMGTSYADHIAQYSIPLGIGELVHPIDEIPRCDSELEFLTKRYEAVNQYHTLLGEIKDDVALEPHQRERIAEIITLSGIELESLLQQQANIRQTPPAPKYAENGRR